MAVITEEVNVGDVTAVPTVHVAGGLGRRQGGSSTHSARSDDLEPTGWEFCAFPHPCISPHSAVLLCAVLCTAQAGPRHNHWGTDRGKGLSWVDTFNPRDARGGG